MTMTKQQVQVATLAVLCTPGPQAAASLDKETLMKLAAGIGMQADNTYNNAITLDNKGDTPRFRP
jgi:hypothetical protein